MDIGAAFIEVMQVVFGFLLLLFLLGFLFSLVIFPRKNSLSAIDRLVYSTVLGTSSGIALVMIMFSVLRFDMTPVNFILVAGVFSAVLLMVWVCERWYLNSRFKKHLEPRLSADYQKLQKYYSRKTNAAKDRFRQDTRTVVVYHESQQSGLNHIDHSYLMDIGEGMDIQQVSEDRLKVTDSFILDPPYPKTRYFELVIREYNEEGVSLVDDLQIYPVLVTKTPDRKHLGLVLQRGTTHISERIYTKTSTGEVEWVYSHDFHIFAIVNAEDTLDQMVDRILGKLDEIALSYRSGTPVPSYAEDREVLKDAYETEIEQPQFIPAVPFESAQPPETRAGADEPEAIQKLQEVRISAETKVILQRPLFLTGAEAQETPEYKEIQTRAGPLVTLQWPVITPGDEPEVITPAPEVSGGVEAGEFSPPPVTRPAIEPGEVRTRPKILYENESKEIPRRPEAPVTAAPKNVLTRPKVRSGAAHEKITQQPVIGPVIEAPEITGPPVTRPHAETKETPSRTAVHAEVGTKKVPEWPVIPTRTEPKELPQHPEIPPEVKPKKVPEWPAVQTGIQQKELPQHPEIPPEVKLKKVPEWPAVQTGIQQKELPHHPEIPPEVKPKKVPEWPVIPTRTEPKEIPKRQEAPVRGKPKEIPRYPGIASGFELKERPEHTLVKPEIKPKEILRHSEAFFNVDIKEIFKHHPTRQRAQPQEIQKQPAVQIGVESKERDRKQLQKEILQGLEVHGITPDSFAKNKKNIENIQIPKKSDVDKKLAELKEDKEIDWMDLAWLYED